MNNQTIIDRIADRLKCDGIGSLIAEEDLYDLVKAALDKAYFADARSSSSPLVKLVADTVRGSIEKHVTSWVEEHQHELAEKWKAVFDQEIVRYVEKIQEAKMTAHIAQVLRPIIDSWNQERSARGQSQIWIG